MRWPGLLNFAQSDMQSFRATEFDLPESTGGILLVLFGVAVLFGLAIRTSLKDSRFLGPGWRTVLILPRAAVLVLILVVLVNPRSRIQTTQIQRSRVGILVDTSSSMSHPLAGAAAEEAQTVPAGLAREISRADALQSVLIDSGLLQDLSETHAVSVYGFDTQLAGPYALMSKGELSFSAVEASTDLIESELTDASTEESDKTARVSLNTDSSDPQRNSERWTQLFQPRGAESRLGESLHQLIGQISGRTLSGIVVLSDGRSNAGLSAEVAQLRAERTETKIIAVGVGSRRPQINVWVAGMQSPSDVHRGDPFDVSVTVQGNGTQGQQGLITLFQQSAGSDGRDQKKVDEKPFELGSDGIPVEVAFQQQLAVPGRYEYVARVELQDNPIQELSIEDNQRLREVEVTDRKQKVLIISSGPMRDYQFVRNTLFRHSGIDSDVWLQSVTSDRVGLVSQEATRLLTEFPKTEAELFEYDVVVAFDADWSRLTSDQQTFFNRWVSEHSGGVIFVAGQIFTPELAAKADQLRDVAVLYPVVLSRMLASLRPSQGTDEPWPVLLTPEGRASQFMQIADATGKTDIDLWKAFRGIYQSYPVRSVRDGAVVLAEYGNPRARTQEGQPPFLASQYYGTGRTMFLGSAETWRLRAISAEGHQRFWTNLIREVGQGRRRRGRSRGLLLLDRTEVSPGQPVTIRAQLYDTRMQPLQAETVPVSIVDSDGRPVRVPEALRGDPRRPGEFVNTFRPARQGLFRVTVPVSESSDVLQANIEVVLPNLESENPSQNVELLLSLANATGGKYLALNEVASSLSDLLTDRSEPIIVDEQLTTLWDRKWLMYLMIALLSLEWALRRIVRLS